MEGEKWNLNPALWLECAGPLVTLPSIGSHVMYFPQGHSEQVAASTQQEADPQIPRYPNLPSQLICKLHNITLHADQETDEVYAQMTLQPVNGTEKDLAAPDSGNQTKRPTIAFYKTLTASDTSTHGGFSIPRRAAEKVFPPLDYNKQPPAQELLAKDLHNNEWHFRHIYRGQPRRHLLTTGWSVFVSTKRLQAGDTVFFMRDESGQLLLGIRHANRQQPPPQSSLLSSDSMLIGVLAAAAHAAATTSRFTVFYNPRASPSEFVIPLAKYNKAVSHIQVSVGMRFRMELETEDSSTRRYMGTITGIGDLDPERWPKSTWRSLKVGWDESTAGQRQQRVSLWEIEPISAPFLVCHPSLLLKTKRALPSQGSNQNDAFGEEVEGVMKKASTWDRGNCNRIEIQNSNMSTFGLEHWMRVEQTSEVTSTTKQTDYYRAMAAAALQEFRKTDASKPTVQQRPNPPVVKFQQLQFETQHKQPILTASAQQQSNVAQQTHISQLPQQQQMVELAKVQATSLQISSTGPQMSFTQSASLKAPLDLLEANMNMSSSLSSGTNPLQNIVSRMNSSAFMSGENVQYRSNLRSSQDFPLEQTGNFTGTGVGLQDWSPAVHESIQSDAQTILSSQIRNMDVSVPLPDAFIFPRTEPPSQVNLGVYPLQSAGILYKDGSQEPEALSADSRSHLLFGVNIENSLDISGTTSWSGANFTKHKEPQNGFLSGTLFSSSCSNPRPDLQMNSGIMANASLDESGFLQQSAIWPQVQPAPARTFTKVYKLGSVGRSLDITRFKNYNDLRRELAQMFSLQGQLDDPVRSGWQVVFVDNENDVLLVGDDPWEEFVNCVRYIKILSPAEVLQMNQEGIEFLNAVPSQNQTTSSSGDCTTLQDSHNQCSANLSSAFER